MEKTSLVCTISVAIFTFLLMTLLGSVQGFTCFECDGDAPPLCETNSTEMRHSGRSIECPHPNQTHIPGFDDSIEYFCFIMKTVAHSTELVEITKGCVLNQGYFVKGYDDMDKPLILKHGECYVHDDWNVTRDVLTHEVTVCICNPAVSEENCNEKEIAGVGFDDIKHKLRRGKSGASEGRSVPSALGAVIAIVLLLNFLAN